MLPLLEGTLDAFGGARRARGADPAPVDRAAIPSPAAIPSGQIVARATILCEDGAGSKALNDRRARQVLGSAWRAHAIRGLHGRRRHDRPHHRPHAQRGRAHRGDGRDRPQGRGGRPRRLRHRRAPQPAVRAVLAHHDARLHRREDGAPDPLDRDDADHDQRPGQDRRGLRDAPAPGRRPGRPDDGPRQHGPGLPVVRPGHPQRDRRSRTRTTPCSTACGARTSSTGRASSGRR